MFILRIISEEHIFILDRADSPAGVRPDLCTADIQGENKESQGTLGSQIDCLEVRIKGSDEGENDHEKLKKCYRHDDKIDCCCMDLLVYFASCINKSKIVTVHEMFEDEIETTKGSDKRTGNREHDNHGKDEHHPCILLSKSELIYDGLMNSRTICLTS